jgi:hypothetical protein
MRPIALLPISLLACSGPGTQDVTAKLVMSNSPTDWCGSSNPDLIRMDCPFQLGIYFLDTSNADAGAPVLNTTCVSIAGAANRVWKDLPTTLDTSKVKTAVTPQGPFRLEIAVIEPPGGGMCDHDTSVMKAKFHGESADEMADDTTVKRIDVASKCLQAFTPTAMCLP